MMLVLLENAELQCVESRWRSDFSRGKRGVERSTGAVTKFLILLKVRE